MIRIACLLLLFSPLLHADVRLQVLTSVGPLQLIANEIMAGVGSADVLIDADASPHHFQLRPSHLRKVAEADLLVWISDDFETSIARLHGNVKKDARLLQLAKALPADLMISDGHVLDGHLWLSAENVKRIGGLLTTELSVLAPENTDAFHNNAQRLAGKVDIWLKNARERFTVQRPRYITNHQFLAYLERSLDIQGIGSLRNSHDHGGTVRGLSHLQERLMKNPARCLIVDRLPASRQARQIAEQHGLTIKKIDILSGAQQWQSILDLYGQIFDILDTCHGSG